MMLDEGIDIASLLKEFRNLSRHDRRAILDKLPQNVADQLNAILKVPDSSKIEGERVSAEQKSKYAPWITACLSSNKRKDFPALRSAFQMTDNASEALKKSLGMNDADDQMTDQTVVPANDTDTIQDQGPSLVNRMSGFLSNKIMSL